MSGNVRTIFAEHLSYLLTYKGKTQLDMARDLNVATGTVSSWVNGQKFPRADMIVRIADYLGVRMSTLIEKNGLKDYLRQQDDHKLLAAYHSADPSIRAAVRKLLDLPEKGVSEQPTIQLI